MSDKIDVVVDPKSFVLATGETTEATATLRNLGQSVDQLTLSIEMLDHEWYTLPVSSVALFPNDQDNLKLVLHPPKTAEVKPGSYPFRIKVVSQENRDEETTVELAIEIRLLPGLELAISPQSITGWKGGYNIELSNPGDTEAVLRLSASDSKGRLRYRLKPESLTVPANGRAEAALEVRLGWLSFLGGEKEFDFQARATAPEAEQSITTDGQLVRLPFYKYFPQIQLRRIRFFAYLTRIRIPWLRRHPAIGDFKATTDDRRDYKLSWSVKRATEVKLGDEEVESKGEKLLSPNQATDYILTASNKYGTASKTVTVKPITIPEARTSERIRATLSPDRLQVTAGIVSSQTTLQLQNLGDIVDKFLVEVEGVDESWYNRSASSIALMPQATDQVQISFQPPKAKGVKSRVYPFAVTVRSQTTPEEATSILAQLEVLPSIEFKLAVRPYRVTVRRKGTFRVNLANTSVSDANVRLDAVDLEEGLKFLLEDEPTVVPAWNTVDVPVVARPQRGSIIGERKRYDITVTATETTGNSQTAHCELNHHPFIGSWRTVFRLVRILLFIGIIGTLIGFLIHWGGGWRMLTGNPGTWWNQLVDKIVGAFSWFSK